MHDVLKGGGEMGALMRAMDWGATAAGAPNVWPQSLRTAVSIVLETRFPMYIAWGPTFLQFYNDGYRPILGSTKHPDAMGRSARETFAESWHIIGPMFEGVHAGTAVGADDWMLPLDRHGYLEECYFTFSYSPIRDESGGVGGVLVTVTETTARVLGERRMRTLRDLASFTGGTRREEDAWRGAAEALQTNAFDVPFALLYRCVEGRETPELVSTVGFAGSPEPSLPLPFERVLDASGDAKADGHFVPDRGAHFGSLPPGPWPEPARSALVLPITLQGTGSTLGFFVAGLSARRAPDVDYRDFLRLVADRIAIAIGTTRSFERARSEEASRLVAEAERAKQLREETLAVVSHDLRTPLSAIGTAAELLGRTLGTGERDPRLLKWTEIILRGADRMTRLLGDLLDAASIDAGTFSIEPRPCAAEELVREVRETFEAKVAGKGLVLDTHVEPRTPLVACDSQRIVQVLSNLLSNAIKFTESGGRIVLRVAPDGDGARFHVEDTGRGIPADSCARVFDRHWRGARESVEGHGIGLSIAKGIVDAHGGTIGVESAPGRGSTFWFTLPVRPPLRIGSVPPRAAQVSPAEQRHAEGAEKTSRFAQAPPADPATSFVEGGGECGALVRAFDWSKTCLGPMPSWPQSLRTSVSTMLRSPYPIILFWGRDLVMLYNDPFRPILGEKHPATVGASGHEALAEAWSVLGPLMERVLATGEPLFVENGAVFFARMPGGLKEEAYFTWSYNPTIGESGEIAGLFAIASETTRQVVGDRRLGTLRELSLRTAFDRKVDDVFRSVGQVLAQSGADVPFALLYVVEGETARLVSCAGLDRGGPAAPPLLALDEQSPWPLATVARSGTEAQVTDLSALGTIPGGPWPEPANRALVLAVPIGADARTMGVLVAGVSPRLPLDDEYRSFLQLLARQISAGASSARAYEEETQRAEKLAQLDRAKTDFFSNVSHELRTPLTLILGPVEDALGQTAPVMKRRQLELVRRNALRLYKMVNTLLDFARIEAGRAQATFVPIDLAQATAGYASHFQSAAEGAGLELAVDCPPLPEPVFVDPEMWEKIVLNLVSNAIKYTHRGTIRVGLGWEEGNAVLEVEDSGIGIAESDTARVFERFYRVHGTHGRSHEGTGIGLALTRELVELHGGSVSVRSTPGVGSTFTVRIPRGTGHLAKDRIGPPRTPSVSPATSAYVKEAIRWSSAPDDLGAADTAGLDEPSVVMPAALLPSRILVVDDNADLRSYVAGLLGRIFPNVVTATNGSEALAQAREELPSLIVSDVMMPIMDGFELVRELRADPKTRSVPIILLSARAGDESTVEGLDSGADDYLVKPFSSSELVARVRSQLEMSRIRADVWSERARVEELIRSATLRDEFLSLLAHELRTPLTSLELQLDLLLRQTNKGENASVDAQYDAKLRVAVRQTERLTRLIDKLLDVSRVAMGSLVLARTDVDLSEIVGRLLARVDADSRVQGTTFAFARSSAVGSWDHARIEEVVASLLSNAIKYAPGTRVEVGVRVDGASAELVVRDSGIGMSSETLRRIFDKFERGVSADHYGGFGIGLYLARRIVEAHGGSLRAESVEGEGSTFTMTLPLHPPAPASASASAPELPELPEAR